ncbi:MAG: thioredoxin domain-containing protein [Phycisphaerae bacterium]
MSIAETDSSGGPATPITTPGAGAAAVTADHAPSPKPIVRWLLVALAFGGWWVSFDLFKLSIGGAASNPLLQSSCGGTTTSGRPNDCLSVLLSERARVGVSVDAQGNVRRGPPWAGVGMAYFAFVGVWFLLAGLPTRGRVVWHLLVGAVVLIGALVSWHLLGVMAAELKRWCPGCVAAHALNAAILLLVMVGFPWRRPRPARLPRPAHGLALAASWAALATGVGNLLGTTLGYVGSTCSQLKDEYEKIVSDAEFAKWKYERQAPATIPLRDDEAFVGAPDAPRTIVAFVDFQCGACRRASDMVKQAADAHPGRVRVAYRHFPQDVSCNRHFEGVGHPAACDAATAAEAARIVGGAAGYLAMHRLLYERQRDLETRRFADWADEIKLDTAAFRAALTQPAIAERIREDIELGQALGVRATPAVFLDGRRVEYWSKPETWNALLAAR